MGGCRTAVEIRKLGCLPSMPSTPQRTSHQEHEEAVSPSKDYTVQLLHLYQSLKSIGAFHREGAAGAAVGKTHSPHSRSWAKA